MMKASRSVVPTVFVPCNWSKEESCLLHKNLADRQTMSAWIITQTLVSFCNDVRLIAVWSELGQLVARTGKLLFPCCGAVSSAVSGAGCSATQASQLFKEP